MKKYKVHYIDPDAVKKSTDKKIARHESLRVELKERADTALKNYQAYFDKHGHGWGGKPPEGSGYVDPMINKWNNEELNVYSRVKIIEDLITNKFYLNYDKKFTYEEGRSHGTGSFNTLEKATKWFTNQGR